MEKAGNVYVRSNADVGWSDVGTWGSLYQLSRKDRYANAKPAEGCYAYDTRNCIISLPEGKVAVVSGLKEYIGRRYGGRADDLPARRGAEHQEVYRRGEVQQGRGVYLIIDE